MSYEYQENLPPETKARYNQKVKLVGLDKCPYKFAGDEWINNPMEWPSIQYPDVYYYLIKTPD